MLDLKKNRDIGLLIIRVGLGASMMAHGFPKLFDSTKWAYLGSNMQHIGISFFPEFWGFMAGLAEGVGGLFFLLGFLTRTSSVLMAFTMIIAMLTHLGRGDGFGPTSHSVELFFVFAGFVLIGPGRIALDDVWCRRSQACKI